MAALGLVVLAKEVEIQMQCSPLTELPFQMGLGIIAGACGPTSLSYSYMYSERILGRQHEKMQRTCGNEE